jgi:hypothetical protein
MSGALLQLASMGAQDVYLTSNPEITLFKKVYLKYTNFSVETVQVSFDGGYINYGTQATVTLEQTGDLISKSVLVLTLAQSQSDSSWGYVNNLGHAMIDSITVRIGQSDIDTFTFDWIDLYHNLYKNRSHEERYKIMIGDVPQLKTISTNHPTYNLYIPLDFWFSKVSSSAFPICALVNQKFQITIQLKNAIDVINYSGSTDPPLADQPTILSGYMLIDYIYLETDERNLFKQNSHEYLIEQVQDMTDSVQSSINTLSLIFDKPCKYLMWFVNLDRYFTRTPYLSWATDDKWDNALNVFAKLVWLATREGLDATDSLNPYIVFNDTFINIGQVPGLIQGGNVMLETLAAKVNAVILFAENNNGSIVAKATVDNVVIITNTLRMKDMSTTVTEFLNDSNTTSNQAAFLEINTTSIIDVFNTGNFIDRTDNPIVLSSFQLNGKNRFQQRDGYFYNYVQPYYYFTNTPPDGINTYSFSLDPENVQPTGTINLGHVNSKNLLFTLGMYNTTDPNYYNTFFKSGRIRVFTQSYTLLRIAQGQASLAY